MLPVPDPSEPAPEWIQIGCYVVCVVLFVAPYAIRWWRSRGEKS